MKAAFKRSTKNMPSSFVMGISLGSANHTGKPLKAVVECLNNSTLCQGVIDVSDTLRRYTYMLDGTNEKDAHTKAAQEGQVWVQTNAQTLKALRPSHQIIHWDHWLKDRRYPSYLDLFKKAANDNTDLSEAIDADIGAFYKRKKTAPPENAPPLSRAFYLEELAALSIQFEDHPGAQIYPGKQLESLKLIRAGQVQGIPDAIAQTPFYRINVYD